MDTQGASKVSLGVAVTLRVCAREYLFAGAILAVVGVMLGAMGTREVYLGFDSIGHYTRVWFISQRIFTEGVIPLTNDFLEGGKAMAYPYGFLPYTITALLFHVIVDRAVTIMMVAGTICLVGAVSLLKLKRDPVLIAAFVAFLPFIDGLLSFQFVFFWAVFFFYLYVWAMEKERLGLAFALMLATVTTHTLLGAEAVALYMGVRFVTRPGQRRRLVLLTVAGATVLAPVYIYLLHAPAVGEASHGYLIYRALLRSFRGLLLIFWPFLLVRFQPLTRAQRNLVLAAVTLTSVLWVVAGMNNVDGLRHDSSSMFEDYFRSAAFTPQAIYRLPEPPTKEEGEYYFVRHGAVLANDFFTETMFRQNWDSPGEYRDFLTREKVDYVVMEKGYLEHYETDEMALLTDMVAKKEARIAYQDTKGRFTVFEVLLSPRTMARFEVLGGASSSSMPS